MAGEIVLSYIASGQTIVACILSPDRTQVWTGSAFAAWTATSLSQWQAGLIACTELSLSTGDGTAVYAANFPAGITTAGEYGVLFFSGISPNPSDLRIGEQDIEWAGTALESPQSGDAYSAMTAATTELAAVPSSTSSIVDKIRWLFALAKNKLTQTATTQTLLKEDNSTSVAASTVSDDGTTFTRGKFS